MTAPDTNIEKQKRRHWGPLIGIGFVLAFAGLLFVGFFGTQTELVEEDPAAAASGANVSQ
jgi:hypothetical protein